ncbi:cytochrome C [Puniceicoccales bacterium CK1056]|uniref:Cytochrome C n=1 Tax=Oceanipulchritudo coccoides TaxID=2706888 RepID=A0A6B2M0W9_9BACT|nr:cytochrome C [Oceanipulchritudo coccoides]NDV61996.1 cytochrome C [Oceanipulchritudo coccoides]
MPIYEFFCEDNNRIYSFFARSVIDDKTVPICPDNPAYSMKRHVSGFAVIGEAKEPSESGPGDDMDDPRLEAAMAEMEREMATMDEENPDPRKMGQLMRRMSELTGEKLPASMEEMVGRLEAGEDPDKLEEEYGDLAELDDFGDSVDGETGGEQRKALIRRLRGPSRDPELYELRDYLGE